jgi:hypothetical protein
MLYEADRHSSDESGGQETVFTVRFLSRCWRAGFSGREWTTRKFPRILIENNLVVKLEALPSAWIGRCPGQLQHAANHGGTAIIMYSLGVSGIVMPGSKLAQ